MRPYRVRGHKTFNIIYRYPPAVYSTLNHEFVITTNLSSRTLKGAYICMWLEIALNVHTTVLPLTMWKCVLFYKEKVFELFSDGVRFKFNAKHYFVSRSSALYVVNRIKHHWLHKVDCHLSSQTIKLGRLTFFFCANSRQFWNDIDASNFLANVKQAVLPRFDSMLFACASMLLLDGEFVLPDDKPTYTLNADYLFMQLTFHPIGNKLFLLFTRNIQIFLKIFLILNSLFVKYCKFFAEYSLQKSTF